MPPTLPYPHLNMPPIQDLGGPQMMASQEHTGQEAGSRHSNDSSYINTGATLKLRDPKSSQTMKDAVSEWSPASEQVLVTQMIGPRDINRAREERPERIARKLQDFVRARDMVEILPELTIPRDHTVNVNIKKETLFIPRARAKNKRSKTPEIDDQLSTWSLDLPHFSRTMNRKTHFPNQQGGTVDDISAALYQQQTSRLSENMRPNQGIFLKIKNMWRRLARLKALPGHERLEWKCVSFPL
jgi:hypothetical protein